MLLTDRDKEYLKSMMYEEKDFNQIEEAMNKAVLAVFFNDDLSKCKIIDYETAREFLGNEALLGGIARSAFHFSASREIPHTFGKYSVSIDAGEILGGKKSFLFEKDSENFDLEQVEKLKDNPCLKVSNIEWDIDEEEYEDEEELDLPSEIIIPLEKFPNFSSDWEIVSDYISNETGFCHYGFDIDYNYTVEELYKMVDKIDKELEEEYKDGETSWASNLECMREEIEAMICLLEEYEQECNIEQ